jgi:hypothetical protein
MISVMYIIRAAQDEYALTVLVSDFIEFWRRFDDCESTVLRFNLNTLAAAPKLPCATVRPNPTQREP